jgi:hypothetical protein
MDYEQKNPLPIPTSGAREKVTGTTESVFDWEYALRDQRLMNLYEKGKAQAWNAQELDWSVDVDIDRLSAETNVRDFFNNVLKAPKTLTQEEALLFRRHSDAHMLSQFLHGEQGALSAAAKIVQTVPWAEAKFYAANQVADEARHVECYHRYLTEKMGVSYEIHPSLMALLRSLVEDSRWDITYLGMQIMVEGLALAAFGMIKLSMPGEPLIHDITTRIMADEARHVGFGVLSLEKLYTEELTSQEVREREEFVIEATCLMHDRLLQTSVFERLGFDVKVWNEWAMSNPMQQGFRQLTFSKIVPNLKRLGLLTPRVRDVMGKLNLLKFEHEKDSVEDPEIRASPELMMVLASGLASANNAA